MRPLRVLVVADGRPGPPDRRLDALIRSMRRCAHNVTILVPTAEVADAERASDGRASTADVLDADARVEARMAALLGAQSYSRAATASVGFAPHGRAVWNGIYRLRAPWKVAALCGAMQFDALVAPLRIEYARATLSTAELLVPSLLRSLNGSDIKPFVVLLVDRAHAALERSLASARLDGAELAGGRGGGWRQGPGEFARDPSARAGGSPCLSATILTQLAPDPRPRRAMRPRRARRRWR